MALPQIYSPRGSGEAFYTYTPISVVSPRRSLSQSRAAPMSPPTSPPLQILNRLDKSSPEFHDQLCSVLYGEEYVQCVPHLQHDDVVWLINYLDTVRCYVTSPIPHSTQPRFLMVSILLVPDSGSAYAYSEACAAPERYFQDRTQFSPTS